MPSQPPTFELQSHSLYSDGELAPAAVVQAAAEAGVELLALTDHDSVGGVGEASEAARGSGVGFVTGVEISTIYADVADLHILGYCIDTSNEPLRRRLEQSRADRESRAGRMIDALRELGFVVDEGRLAERTAAGKTVGRPHIAEAVMAHPANAERIAAEGHASASAFLVAYLIEGRPAFRPRAAPSVPEAIELIHGAGGLAVWAHPFWDIPAPARVLETLAEFKGMGIDGVEAFYVTHTQEQTELLVKRSEELHLLITGSSDFHGPNHRQFNRFRAFDTHGLEPRLGRISPS